MIHVAFILNGQETALDCAPDRPLVTILREDLGLTGTKLACGVGRCGACMVLLDGVAVNACLLMAWQVAGRRIDTIEGVRADPRFAPVLEALAQANSFQCGYCAAGVTIALAGALGAGANTDDAALITALEGNICRCTGYQSILHGAQQARARLRAERPT
ncbi:(2Fe-2S)-binding protein [Roseinatronobacter sp. NSM]|uniref:(2Fe-2S)-binding protein n=1 Tax=Roseinatronobacter sp. NSM TaxID=3457785 RepID=UPI0040367F44